MARSPRTLLLATSICVGLFLVLLVLAYASSGARTLDANALQGFVVAEVGSATLGERMVALGNPGSVAVSAVALALVALLRGRPRVSLAVIFLVGATSISSQALKAVFAYPRAAGEGVLGPEAFPSGHSTAAMTLALCAVLVAPARLRPLVAVLGTGFALAVGFALISTGSHFPSDVVGGYLLATGWTFATAAALLAVERRRPERPGRLTLALRSVVDRIAAVGLLAALVAAAALLMAATAVVATQSDDLGAFVRDHTAAVVVAPAVASAAALLLAAVTAVLRRE